MNGDKAQSVIIGTMLLLAVAITFVSYMQVVEYPDRNLSAENEKHSQMASELTNLQSAINDVAATGSPKSVSFTTLTNYPTQPIPPDRDAGQFVFKEYEDPVTVRTKPGGEVDLGLPKSTQTIEYNPSYVEFSDPPELFIENSLVVERSQLDGTLPISQNSQSMVSQRSINLIYINTDVDGIKKENPSFTITRMNTEKSIIGSSSDEIELRIKSPSSQTPSVLEDYNNDMRVLWNKEIGNYEDVTVEKNKGLNDEVWITIKNNETEFAVTVTEVRIST